jgi:hypothetical protein
MARKTLKDILDQQSEAKAKLRSWIREKLELWCKWTPNEYAPTQSYTDLCKLEGPSNA